MKMSSPVKSSYEIKFLKEFLKKCLKVEVLDYNLKCLTKPGDNYGGVIQSLDVKITNERDENVVSHESKLKNEKKHVKTLI